MDGWATTGGCRLTNPPNDYNCPLLFICVRLVDLCPQRQGGTFGRDDGLHLERCLELSLSPLNSREQCGQITGMEQPPHQFTTKDKPRQNSKISGTENSAADVGPKSGSHANAETRLA